MMTINNYRFVPILFLLQFLCFTDYGQNVQITGNDPVYKGEKITFYTSPNPFIRMDKQVGECNVNSIGDFFCELNIEQTCKVHVPLGIYRGYLYVIPGHRYKLSLPPFQEKTIAQELNPYFKEKIIHLQVLNEDTGGLNYLIKKFDDLFYPMLNDAVIEAYTNLRSEYDSVTDNIDNLNDNYSNPFYDNYKTFNLELFRVVSSGKSTKQKKLFSSGKLPLKYNNPSCIALINQLFNNYFSKLGRTDEGKIIYSYINRQGSYSSLFNIVKNDLSASNDSLPEFVIMKNINEEFNRGRFSKSSLLEILDSLRLTTDIEAHRTFAKQIRENITRIMVGSPAPEFTLKTSRDSIVSLNKFKGKYVYLGFCSTRSYPCMQHFGMLDSLSKKFNKDLAIVILMVDKSESEVEEFAQDYGFEENVLSAGKRKKIFRQYKIRAYPTYYLIDPEGNFLLSPAPSPAENFELVFRNILSKQ